MVPKEALPKIIAQREAEIPPLPEYRPLLPSEVNALKANLLNTASAALIKESRAAGTTSIASRITDMVVRVSFFDPEFGL